MEIWVNAQDVVVDYHPLDSLGWHRIIRGRLVQPLVVDQEWAVIRAKTGKEVAYAIRPLLRSKVAAMPVGELALFFIDKANKIVDATFGSEEALQRAIQGWQGSPRVDHGHATLYGEVRTPEEKGLAALVATTVPGVEGLTNSIIVEPALSPDHKLSKAIWNAFRTVPVLEQNDTLKVSVKDAVAKLGGTVDRPLQKEAAEKAAASVPGVARVVDLIEVKPASPDGLMKKGTVTMREEGVQAVP